MSPSKSKVQPFPSLDRGPLIYLWKYTKYMLKFGGVMSVEICHLVVGKE